MIELNYPNHFLEKKIIEVAKLWVNLQDSQVLATPMMSYELCWVLAMIHAGAPSTAVVWTSIERASYTLLYLISAQIFIVTCEYFAQPFKWNFMKTLCVWAGIVILVFFTWQAKISLETTGGLGSLLSSLLVLLISIFFVCDGAANLCQRCRKAPIL